MSSPETAITKKDLKGFQEEIVHQFHVQTESLRDEIKQVAEGVIAVDQKIERTCQELKDEINNKTRPIAQAVIALDAKVDRIHLELKTEIQETRQEILAAVKFSYAELDKCRLATSPP